MKVNISPHPTRPGWYYLTYRPHGTKGKRERIPVEGYEEAQRQQALLEGSSTRRATVTAHPTIKSVYEEYLTWVELNQSPDTYRCKKNAFKHIIPHFGPYRVQDLTQMVYDEFHRKMKGKRRAIIAYQHYLAALIKWMVKRNLATPLPFKPEEPKYKPGKPVIPSMQDIQTVIDSVDDPGKKALLVTMLWTGLRWNEARLLLIEDVYLDRGIIRVRESDVEEEVHVAIYPEMESWLRTAVKKKKGWLFPNPKTGEPWTSFKRLLKTASAPLARKISHHDFRRRSGQNVYEAAGYDVFAAQQHLRHQEIRTTMRYLGIDDQRRSTIRDNLICHVANLRTGAKPLRKRNRGRSTSNS